ncbi:MAG: hypothetical protein DCO96_09215 [Fluviicola sp. XM-24bin1]|nr:MAG: hypothetical protein DCO96_09215 [Fluviicola sp. XM-24bin1]
MKKKHFQLFLVAVPMFAMFLFTGCSDESSDSSGEDPKTEEETPKEPLVDRDPQVKEYFKVLNEMINEYLTVGETTLDIAEKLDQGDLNLLDAATATAELIEAMESIEELNESLTQQGTIKENIEKNLNAKDMLEFKDMYSESMARMDSISKRIEEIDWESYIEGVDLF